MNHLDEFESMFKRAQREPYAFQSVQFRSVMLVTDGTLAQANSLKASLQAYLPVLSAVENWRIVVGSDYSNVSELLELLQKDDPQLIVTYRHLHEESLIPQHSLGVYLDVLTQATKIPVLVLPGTAGQPVSIAQRTCRSVMVVTDHISGDSRLINHGVAMCRENSELWLCHVEDDKVFERYMRALSQIPEIDTDQARQLIDRQLLKDAQDFIETCTAELAKNVPKIHVHSHVERGHHLGQYRQLVAGQQIDLLVANTKDDDQLAMHGIAYAIAVEMTDLTLLLL